MGMMCDDNVHLPSCVQLFVASWTAAHQASLSFTISGSLFKVMSIESVMPSNHFILCCRFTSCLRSFPASGSFPMSWSLHLLPSIFPSLRVFSNELALCIRWPKYWSFSLSNSSSNEYSKLISFRVDWFDLVAVQETPKSLLQHYNS